MAAPLFWSRLARDPWARFGLGLVALLALLALLAPWLAPGDPFRGDLAASLRPPSGAFLLGSDAQGRDVLSRVLYGARLSLAVGLISQSIALALGVTLGLVSGYYGRWIDGTIMRVADVTLAFPSLLLLIAIAAAVKPSLPVVFVVIGLVGWAGMARLVRGQVLLARGLEYVQAARALGASDVRIIARHLLPNVIAPVIVAATLGIGGAIMAEAALSFIGLGAQPPTPSWGAMVAEGRDLLRVAPWVSIAPGVAIGLAVLGLNLLAAARLGIAQLINADPSEIALATNTGFGLNLAARALPLKPGDVVLLSDKEFPANVYPWLMLRDQGITVEVARCRPEGWPDEEHLLQRLRDPKVRVLAVSFVQFSNGYRADLQKLGAACRANGTYLVVDGIQGIGNSVLDVTETPVDILACGGQKWLLSPWGSGFVYVRKELVQTLEPAITSWMAFEGTDDFSRLTEYNPTFRADARRFEMITLPFT